MGLELDSALGNTVERSFFAPHFDLETFWKHRRVCPCGMLYFIDMIFVCGYHGNKHIIKIDEVIY